MVTKNNIHKPIVIPEFDTIKQGDCIVATNSTDAFDKININQWNINGCDFQYFIKKTTAWFLCTDNYIEYKKLQRDDYVWDIRVTTKIYRYIKQVPKWYVVCDNNVYKEKEIVDNCKPMENKDIIYVNWEIYDWKQIEDELSPIELIEINWKYYSSTDVEEECEYL